MYEAYILEKMQCSKEEKEELFPLVDELLELSNRTRQYGILALEQNINHTSDKLLKKGLELVVNGTDPAIIRDILLNYSFCGKQQGKELLRSILITEGMLSIQQGIHPNLLKEILLSFFGIEILVEAGDHFHNNLRNTVEFMKSYLSELPEEESDKRASSILTGPFERMNERCLQRLLREIDYELIAVAISGEGKNIQEKVLSNVSPRLATWMIEQIRGMKNLSPEVVLDAQKSIVEEMKSLVKQGEIFI